MKVTGKFKDEYHGQLILKCVGLRPKLYSYDYEKLTHYGMTENGVVVCLTLGLFEIKGIFAESLIEVSNRLMGGSPIFVHCGVTGQGLWWLHGSVNKSMSFYSLSI